MTLLRELKNISTAFKRWFGTVILLLCHILTNWQSIVEDTFDTPSKHPVPQEALHSISRLSGAFVEQTGVQEVRVSLSLVHDILTLPFKLRVRAKHPSNIMLAKRLAIRANYQVCT